ncbi:MAG: hypothetical protein ACD_58C00306G0007 [uncultured bacterium]|nr:MAG: hypothetical protein ACD_58C00306G0007 [uncultured bacterium]
MEFKDLFPNMSSTMLGLTGLGFGVMMLWSMVWKGLALWRAARRNENVWFIVLLVVNTVGILEIIYYFLVAKTDKKA